MPSCRQERYGDFLQRNVFGMKKEMKKMKNDQGMYKNKLKIPERGDAVTINDHIWLFVIKVKGKRVNIIDVFGKDMGTITANALTFQYSQEDYAQFVTLSHNLALKDPLPHPFLSTRDEQEHNNRSHKPLSHSSIVSQDIPHPKS